MNLPKMLMMIGVIIFGLGLVAYLLPPDTLSRIGRLPGDFRIEKENVKIYFLFMTSIILSIVLSLIFWLLRKF